MSRILLISDVHLCHVNWYGRSSEMRLEKMLADINEEHKKQPIDMILMLGDYSLDYWECAPYGSYSVNGISNTQRFIKDYVTRFPCPTYLLPGNHEQYTHEAWRRLTGFKRQFSVIYENNLFLMLDNFGDNLNAKEHNHGTYSYADVAYIKAEMEKHPDKRVFLCAHDFYFAKENEEFKKLVREDDRILALFGGHTHVSHIEPMGEELGNKCLFRTGEYSYCDHRTTSPDKSIWGFRELILEPNCVSTAYIIPQNEIIHDNQLLNIPYHKQDDAIIRTF